jgi:hypothetical protein
MLIWMFIAVFADIFRREDLSGGSKAIWILAIFILPLLGILIYIFTRPKVTPGDVKMMAQVEAQSKAAAGVSTADELTKLQQLKASGAITEPEYETLKAKLLAIGGRPERRPSARRQTPHRPNDLRRTMRRRHVPRPNRSPVSGEASGRPDRDPISSRSAVEQAELAGPGHGIASG